MDTEKSPPNGTVRKISFHGELTVGTASVEREVAGLEHVGHAVGGHLAGDHGRVNALACSARAWWRKTE
jgi:hypothetical protein